MLWYVLELEVIAVRMECVSAVKDGVVQTVVQHSVLKTATQREDTVTSRETVGATTTGTALTVQSFYAIQTAAL